MNAARRRRLRAALAKRGPRPFGIPPDRKDRADLLAAAFPEARDRLRDLAADESERCPCASCRLLRGASDLQ